MDRAGERHSQPHDHPTGRLGQHHPEQQLALVCGGLFGACGGGLSLDELGRARISTVSE